MSGENTAHLGPKWQEFAYGDYHEIVAWELQYLVRRYVEYWEIVSYEDPNKRGTFCGEVEIRRISVVVFTCVLLESAINFYLCTKSTAAEFKKLDGLPLELKWSKAPSQFVPKYAMDSSPGLLQDLRDVINRRKAIVHSKPQISFDGDNRHKGNEPTYVLDEHDFMRRCASLPWRLVENLLKTDFDAYSELSGIRPRCGEVQREFSYGDYWIGQMGRAPEDLILEIMTQGYTREVAHRYAVYIDDRPKQDKNGNILVKRGRQEIARLRPLKFFSDAKS